MLESLKAIPLFRGYRGKAPLDLEALADMIANVARLASDKRDTLAELDINPVFVYERGQGVCAADDLAVVRESLFRQPPAAAAELQGRQE